MKLSKFEKVGKTPTIFSLYCYFLFCIEVSILKATWKKIRHHQT